MRTTKTKPHVLAAVRASIQDTIGSEDAVNIIADAVFLGWHTAFMAKAYGGADEHGNTWEPLAESTIKRKASKGQRAREQAWEDRFSSLSGQLQSAGMSRKDAEAKAAGMAWDTEVHFSEVINVATGELEESLDPSGHPEQVREVSGEALQLGTAVEHAKYVDKKRRFKPTAVEAATWVARGADEVRQAIADKIESKVA